MAYKLEVRRKAEIEMQEAYNWYEVKVPGKGDEFLDEVDTVFGHIKDNPLMFAERAKGQRAAGVKNFPYLVFYRIAEKLVSVVSVFHTSRDPGNIS